MTKEELRSKLIEKLGESDFNDVLEMYTNLIGRYEC